MFDIRWLGYTNPLEDNIKSVGDFFSRCGLEDHKEDILALDKVHRGVLEDLAKVKERLEDYYIRDQTQTEIKTDNFGGVVLDIEIVPNDSYDHKRWLEEHLKYRFGSEKSWYFGKLEEGDRVVIRALIEREKELIESSEKLATQIIDLMSKGQ